MPVTSIKALDQRELPFVAEQIWPVLADVAAYPQWWPAAPAVKPIAFPEGTVGSEIEIRPRGGRAFRCRVESIAAPHRMRLRYGGGFISGIGEWRLAAVPGGTRVIYELDVTAAGWLVALLGRCLSLGRVHSKSMQKVLEGLEGETGRRMGSPSPREPGNS